jgi:Major Facilitator Superfamily.
MCAASQLTVVPGVLSDVFDNRYRGVAVTLYALTVFVGPFSAPFTGGFIATSYLGWRWTLYIPAILSLFIGAISLLFLRETFAPVILMDKAYRLRRQTGNWGIHAKQEKIEVGFKELMEKYFTRPLRLLVTEPIILFVSMYMSFIYGIVYALLEAYPYVFEEIYGMKPGISGLPFIGLIVGQVLGCSLMLSQHGTYIKRLAENKGESVPEWRLRPTILGAPIFTIGIFWQVFHSIVSTIGFLTYSVTGSAGPGLLTRSTGLRLRWLESLSDSGLSVFSCHASSISSMPICPCKSIVLVPCLYKKIIDKISTEPRRQLQQTSSSDRRSPQGFLFFPSKCSRIWVFNGRQLFLDVWLPL